MSLCTNPVNIGYIYLLLIYNYSYCFLFRTLEKYYVGDLVDNEMPIYAIDK